ncbi:hypothetical protein BV22DRAFT_744435 [Leucogyrophana mollusca]|uniref:Uncharacterized protein n=1 Tax=Leucogyrophana mollusca TaxID=85980 RepID=A0ACB8B6B1_9AGAM|nr:hypothetical protein BV22DRAFT_744435 [Leucogyrophana mollusca]
MIRRWVRRQLRLRHPKLDIQDVTFIATRNLNQEMSSQVLGRRRGLTIAEELRAVMVSFVASGAPYSNRCHVFQSDEAQTDFSSASVAEESFNIGQSVYYSCNSASPRSAPPIDDGSPAKLSDTSSSSLDFEDFSYISALTTPAQSPEAPRTVKSGDPEDVLPSMSTPDELIRQIPGSFPLSMSVDPVSLPAREPVDSSPIRKLVRRFRPVIL